MMRMIWPLPFGRSAGISVDSRPEFGRGFVFEMEHQGSRFRVCNVEASDLARLAIELAGIPEVRAELDAAAALLKAVAP